MNNKRADTRVGPYKGDIVVNEEKNRRRSIRLRDYDYSQPGFYFVTICASQGQNLFGEYASEEVQFSKVGEMIKAWWAKLPNKFGKVVLDEFVIMPDHLHGLMQIVQLDSMSTPLGGHMGPPLPEVIQWFKTMTTNDFIRLQRIDAVESYSGKLWQRNYYERVIRNEKELETVRDYIKHNPTKLPI